MIFYVFNPFTGERFTFDGEKAASVKVEELKQAISDAEEYQFTVAKETVNGNDTTWTNADLDNDPEDNVYYVFNPYTGQHEKMLSLSTARIRRQEIKARFMQELGIRPISKDELEQPASFGTQTL